MNLKNNKIVNDFGNEWEKFNQIKLNNNELDKIFYDYFNIFPWDKIGLKSKGIDCGCGTGRWAKLVAPKCKNLTVLDASLKSIRVAKQMLNNFENVDFIISDLTKLDIKDSRYDFAYSLGVLHHVPNINKALSEINRILKKNSPFLIYLYYSFDNAPNWYRLIWKASNMIRKVISILPKYLKMFICDLIALFIYLPLARTCFFLERIGINYSNIPLSYYRNKSFYTMRTDSLDRFGTTYEKRYSKEEIKKLLISSGFHSIKFSLGKPYWCALAYKK